MGYYDKYPKSRCIRSRHPNHWGDFVYLVIIYILEQSTPARMGEAASAAVGHVRLCSLIWTFLVGRLRPALRSACPIGPAPPTPIGSQPPPCRPGASGERLGPFFCSHPLAAPSVVSTAVVAPRFPPRSPHPPPFNWSNLFYRLPPGSHDTDNDTFIP